jgi:hypothetical protein
LDVHLLANIVALACGFGVDWRRLCSGHATAENSDWH